MEVDPLDTLISRETMEEILKLLTPAELMVAVLRAEGLSDVEIAEFLGIGPMAVHRRVDRAKKRIMKELPEAAHLLEGRRKGKGQGRRQVEGGEGTGENGEGTGENGEG
jgi:hypothetical protein